MLPSVEDISVKQFTVTLPKRGTIYAELWFPSQKERLKRFLLIWIHWMDSRGFSGSLPLYPNFAKHFAKKGYPVILYDQLGSGKSTGTFEFPRKQADQFVAVVEKGLELLSEVFSTSDLKSQMKVIGIGHSLGGVTLMHVIKKKFPMPFGIFVSVPPSHGFSIKHNIIKQQGRMRYWLFLLSSYLDPILGLLGKPLTVKFFGFKLRLFQIRKEMLTSHAIIMARKHPEVPILAIYGTNDEYTSISEIHSFLPDETYPWIKRILIQDASHDMLKHQEELFRIIERQLEQLGDIDRSKHI